MRRATAADFVSLRAVISGAERLSASLADAFAEKLLAEARASLAVRQLKQRGMEAKVIFVTMHTGVDFAVQARRIGASGYILKVDASEELTRAITEALKGRLYITPSIARHATMSAIISFCAMISPPTWNSPA